MNVGDPSIDTMSAPVGENLGSSHIDRMFEEFAKGRLRQLSYELKPVQQWELDQLSYAMRHDRDFEENKKVLGDKALGGDPDLDHFTVKGPDLSTWQGKDMRPWALNGRIRFDL